MKPYIVTLTGPSCAGKSTLERMLKERGFANCISTTTRAPRAGEAEGEHYYFVTGEHFGGMLRFGQFVEHVEFGGNLYGLSVAEVRRVAETGRPIVIVVEPCGMGQIRTYARKHGWDFCSVFVNNPLDVTLRRFLHRSMEDSRWNYTAWLDKTVERLETMVTTERMWQKGAQSNYDLYVPCFNERNDVQLADYITGRATHRAEQEDELRGWAGC